MNLNELRDEAYSIAKANGWHEQEYSDEHEEWKDIHGYEGQYQVSNMGRVRSLDRTINNHGKFYFKKGVNYTDILYCCRGKLKTAGGFIWELSKPKMDYNRLRGYHHGGKKY